MTPATDFWLRLGPTWLSSSLIEQITWFQKYASERSVASQYKLGWTVPASRMTFRIKGDWRNAHERPGFEIDGRVQRKEFAYTTGIESQDRLDDVHRRERDPCRRSTSPTTRCSRGFELDTSLNRHTTTGNVAVRQDLTTLTSMAISGSHSVDQFDYSTERDSTSSTANFSMSFQPAALLRGGFSVGYNQFKPNSPDLPGYSGLVDTVDLTYVLLGSTRFAVERLARRPVLL